MSVTPSLIQFRRAASVLRTTGHPEVAEFLRLSAKRVWLARDRKRKVKRCLAEDLAKCTDPNDEGAGVETITDLIKRCEEAKRNAHQKPLQLD